VTATGTGKPLVIDAALAREDYQQRARIAADEEAAELARMTEQLDLLRSLLLDLRATRTYRLLRRLGRWGSLERGMRRAGLL
jgi:hypothetical protein